MSVQQTEHAIVVFGSAILRVEPDMAALNFSVSRLDEQPGNAFQQTREAVQQVRTYLVQAEVTEVSTSRVKLSQSFRYEGNSQKFVGYLAEVSFNVLLNDLDQVEALLVGIIDAGVNNIGSVDFQTTQLKAMRAEARRQAVQAGREKAEVYCQAAGVELGRVIYIEDQNPDMLRGREGHVSAVQSFESDSGPQAFDPGSIVIGAAVKITFTIE